MKPAKEILGRMGVPLPKIQESEAKILEMRWGAKWKYILLWMQARGFITIMDLIGTFGGDHSECMRRAQADFWEFST